MESAVVMSGEDFKHLVGKIDIALEGLSKLRENKKEFLSNEEFLKLMSISKRTAQSWRDEGIVSFSQIGGKIYYRMEDIKEILIKHRRPSF